MAHFIKLDILGEIHYNNIAPCGAKNNDHGGMFMDTSKVTAIVLAVLAAALVIIAGKSCTDDIASSNRISNRKKNITTIASTAPYTAPDTATDAPDEPETEPPTLPYDIVTNMIGEVVETIPKATDENGEIEVVETTGTKSILEQYDDLHTTTEPPEQETTEETTERIKPAEHIVIQVG